MTPRPLFAAAALALAATVSAAALAGTVTVVTSFPKDLTQAYKSAFEKANPGIKLEILNKNTIQGIAYVRELPAGQRPDSRSQPPSADSHKRSRRAAAVGLGSPLSLRYGGATWAAASS